MQAGIYIFCRFNIAVSIYIVYIHLLACLLPALLFETTTCKKQHTRNIVTAIELRLTFNINEFQQ